MNNQIMCFVWTGLFAAALCAGCGEKLPSNLPKLHPTVITVIQDGKPLPGALIKLVNVDPTIDWACVAKTDASGKATMKTSGMYDGAPEGTYKATVVKQEVESGDDPYADAPDPEKEPVKYQEWKMQNAAKIEAAERRIAVVHDLVDPQYGNMSDSKFEIVVASGTKQHTLDVGKAVRTVRKAEQSR